MQSINSRIIFRVKREANAINGNFNNFVQHYMSRDSADQIRKKVTTFQKNQIVDHRLKNELKKYSKDVFGSAGYWHWLALYTELRGEFLEGWLPIDYYRFTFLPKVNPEKFMRMSEAKTMDHKTFDGYIINPLIIRLNGLFYNAELELIEEKKVYQILNDLNEEIIIKPDNGRQGQGVIFKSSHSVKFNELPSETDLVIQRKVFQHEMINEIYPQSVNTFRVLSFINKTGLITIKFIILRFGTGGQRVDNMNAGGGWLYIYPDGKTASKAYNKFGISIGEKHPNTGVRFSSLHFPIYDKIASFCRQAHKEFPFTRLIGWDVYVNKDGEPNLIEWNANNPTIDVIEALYGPLFDLEEIL